MIDLLNRRFVCAYFNTGGSGLGHDKAATEFVTGKVENKWAFFAAFKPDGTYLGSTPVYADKNEVFEFLVGLLEKHPELARPTVREQRVLKASSARGASVEARLAVARLHEELGEYRAAERSYEKLKDQPEIRVHAALSVARIARYGGRWDDQERALALLRKARLSPEDAARVVVEDGHRLIARSRYADAREILQPASAKYTETRSAAELHFCAGVVCWLGGDRDWGRFHWGWVLANRPDDRLYWRAYVAAAEDVMGYPNAELKRDKVPVGRTMVSPQMIQTAVRRTMRAHDLLTGAYEAGEYQKLLRPEPKGAIAVLVDKLRDGTDVRANNKIVAQLVEIGDRTIEPLLVEVRDPLSPRRGYAGFALGKVMKACGKKPHVVEAMRKAARESVKGGNPYVVGMLMSGLKLVGERYE